MHACACVSTEMAQNELVGGHAYVVDTTSVFCPHADAHTHAHMHACMQAHTHACMHSYTFEDHEPTELKVVAAVSSWIFMPPQPQSGMYASTQVHKYSYPTIG